ncbi:hypothetical protein BLOT_016108 [Blomia tropicalis]|nr:hypothetical protein BLOT_016108 [Blomia tropicalis]
MEETYSSEQQNNNRRSRRSVHQPDKNQQNNRCLEVQKSTKKKTESMLRDERLKYCKLIEVAYHEMQIQLDLACDINMLRDWMKALVELNIDLEIDSLNDKHITMVKQLIEYYRSPSMTNLTQFTTKNNVNSETDFMEREITNRKQSGQIKTCTPVCIKTDIPTESHLSNSNEPEEEEEEEEEVTGNKFKRTVQCDICFKEFSCETNLWRHNKLRKNNRIINCKQCQKSFCLLSDYKKHNRFYHEKIYTGIGDNNIRIRLFKYPTKGVTSYYEQELI